jgi:peroxiredoxin
MQKILSIYFSVVFYFIYSFCVSAQVPATADLASPLPVGSIIPEVALLDLDGKSINTTQIFNKPTVMVVYRGGWCPYCNNQLAGLGLIEKDIISLGYKIIAVSPDAPEQLKSTLEKQKIGYQLFSDGKGDLIKAMGLAFAAPNMYNDMLLKASGGANTEAVLPVPAVYIVDKMGKVLYMFSNPDYKVRLDENVLMTQIKSFTK